MNRHLVVFTILICVATTVYFPVTQAYFCGFDDFANTHQAAFEDSRNPAGIFTKAHFGSNKYRPLGRALNYVIWKLGEGPLAFRIRNLAFHLVIAMSVYGIMVLLTGVSLPAAAAALLFTLHPLANQSVVASTWWVTTAYGFFYLSFFLFLYSLRTAGGHWLTPLLGSLASAWIGLFLYEPVIVIFGFMYGYLFLHWLEKPVRRSYLICLSCVTALILVTFVGARLAVVADPSQITPVWVVVRNALLYAGSLAMPVDFVFLNSLFGTPLPSELTLDFEFILWAGAVAFAALAGLGSIFVISAPLRARLRTVNWREILFFLLAMVAGVSPYLVFTDHPSETYLYLPTGLYAIVVCLLLWRLAPSRRVFVAMLGLLLTVFTASTWMRNRRVISCGQIASRILSNLPVTQWRSGQFDIRLAKPASEPAPRMYGIYRCQGLATIDPGSTGMPIMEMAVQLAIRNEQVKVRIVEPAQMREGCAQPGSCFWVMSQGEVADVADMATPSQ